MEENLIRQVAEILKVPAEAIKSFNEEAAIQIFNNTFNDSAGINAPGNKNTVNVECVINPIEKWVEALEEIKRLNEEKIALYERMLKEKDEMIGRLEKLLNK